jgi:hypothetical protein
MRQFSKFGAESSQWRHSNCKVPIPSGEKGYYFGISHTVNWWEAFQCLAEALYARGLVAEPKVQIWPSDEVAAEYLGFPPMYVRMIGTSGSVPPFINRNLDRKSNECLSGEFVVVNAYQLGWQPRWDKKRFLENIDEVAAVLELHKFNASVFDSLMPSGK